MKLAIILATLSCYLAVLFICVHRFIIFHREFHPQPDYLPHHTTRIRSSYLPPDLSPQFRQVGLANFLKFRAGLSVVRDIPTAIASAIKNKISHLAALHLS